MQVTQMSFDALCRLLQENEKRSGMSSIEFFNRYTTGKLGDAREYIEWAGLYRVYLKMCLAHLPPEPATQVVAV